MSTKVVTFGDATINTEQFQARVKYAMGELKAEHDAKEAAKTATKEFKDTVEAMASQFKLSKPELAKYLRARFEDTLPKEDEDKKVGTDLVIERGELYTVLNSTLEG